MRVKVSTDCEVGTVEILDGVVASVLESKRVSPAKNLVGESIEEYLGSPWQGFADWCDLRINSGEGCEALCGSGICSRCGCLLEAAG